MNRAISGIFSITFDTPHETLLPLTNVDNTAEKILHLQYPHLTFAAVFSNGDCLLNFISLIFNANQMLALQFRLAMVVELMKFSNFYLTLNSAKNSDMSTTYNKEREYIEKCISDSSNIVEFNSNVDDNDGESSSSSSLYTTNNEKNVRKKQMQNSQK
ncbi:hypothetical protein RhiirA4_550708 [Rhizophagus irregularis]|uniref:Uncharacterized protein n=1 Tax=Rhizophagus irregularis TaxID=588596 RepID=A0A2I1HP01_9GLOM|nr:hypothetical protein RhiirA4_550708 [Rhizophagus irregularis]